MESRAKIRGHSIHPMLVAFPVALYATTLVAFVVHATTRSELAWHVGLTANLLAVLAALVAATPGFVDLFALSVDDPARRTGLAHMSLNLTALGLFGANLFVQSGAFWGKLPLAARATLHVLDGHKPDALIGLLLSGGGVAVTLAAGALGWLLVHRHGLGKAPRDDVMKARLTTPVAPVVDPL